MKIRGVSYKHVAFVHEVADAAAVLCRSFKTFLTHLLKMCLVACEATSILEGQTRPRSVGTLLEESREGFQPESTLAHDSDSRDSWNSFGGKVYARIMWMPSLHDVA